MKKINWYAVSAIFYLTVYIGTFIYLLCLDWNSFNYYNWLWVVPLDLFTAFAWPLYWLYVGPLYWVYSALMLP